MLDQRLPLVDLEGSLQVLQVLAWEQQLYKKSRAKREKFQVQAKQIRRCLAQFYFQDLRMSQHNSRRGNKKRLAGYPSLRF